MSMSKFATQADYWKDRADHLEHALRTLLEMAEISVAKEVRFALQDWQAVFTQARNAMRHDGDNDEA